MDGSSQTGMVVKRVPETGVETKRRRWSVKERRRIVEETLVAGATVARVARAYGVNANQVFSWRRLYRRGQLGGAAEQAALLAVTISDTAAKAAPVAVSDLHSRNQLECAPEPALRPAAPGPIHIQLPKARLRIEGTADESTLRAVLEALRG
jgi:transposase